MDRRLLAEHVSLQWSGLCRLAGVDPRSSGALLADLLGATGERPLADGPATSSDVADDHTPLEYSLAFRPAGPSALRVLAEAQPLTPGPADLAAGYDFLGRQQGRPGFTLQRLDQVRDIFDSESPQGLFGIWHSVVFRGGGAPPEFKIYLNPGLHGEAESPEVVKAAFTRLGLSTALPRIGQAGNDSFAFFALDLHDGPRTRIKLYVAHRDATLGDVVHAAGLVGGVDPDAVAAFCTAAAGHAGPFTGRPMLSSYTFTPGTSAPVGYSLYVPIRSYVRDDEEARARLMTVLRLHGLDAEAADRAIDAVARRPLRDGVGLIAHLSLRLGPPQPGVTVYLSAEAYRVSPPRSARLVT